MSKLDCARLNEMVAFFWLMTLLPSESQQPDERLSLVWTMVYALAAAFAFAFFNDDVVGRWYPELACTRI